MGHHGFFIRLAPLGGLLFSAYLRAADVPLSDGQNAEDVVGQTDAGGGPNFTSGGPFNSTLLKGVNGVFDVEVDTVGHRLFVSDQNTNRILEYDLDPGNILVDRNADHVLGQVDFYGADYATNANRFYYPYCLAFDPESNRLFAVDYNNRRVLIFDVASITDGEDAINVLGQSNFTSRTSATTQNGMSGPRGISFDAVGHRLFVSEYSNNRISIFDLTSVTDGENAVNVLGQSYFTSGSGATTQNRLKNPQETLFDGVGNKLYVADTGNNRVMVFDVASISDGENAVSVLGQTAFTTGSAATAQGRMSSPVGLAFDGANQRLFVGDSSTHRVLVFDVASITDGENAINVLGQADFTTGTNGTAQSRLYTPYGLGWDPGGNRLYVAEWNNFRALVFDVSTTTITNGENAENVVGQTDGVGGPSYTTSNIYDGSTEEGYYWAYDVAIDTATHRLFVADTYGNRVMVYDLDYRNTLVDRAADHVLGQADYIHTGKMTNQYSTYGPTGLSYDARTQMLYVVCRYSHRVVVFDVASITNGENAVHVLGQPTFTSTGTATTQGRMNSPYNVDLEAGASRLYVSESGNNRVLVFDVSAITDGENAINVLGQSNFTTSASGLAQNRMFSPVGVKHDGTSILYVADYSNIRVLSFDTTVISDGENAISVLGQSGFATNTSGVTQSLFFAPWNIATDRAGNRLFVGDPFNNRILVFDTTVITNGENAVHVLGQADFTSVLDRTTQDSLNFPMGMAYDPAMNRLYISDQESNRVVVHSVGPVPPSTSTVVATTGVTPGEIDLSWASAGDDGPFDTLTGAYRIQCSTSVNTAWSTSSTPAGAITVTIPVTGETPGVMQSTSVFVTPTPMQPWYFVIWTQDDASNWSAVSTPVSAWPPVVDPEPPMGPFTPTELGGGLTHGGATWGDFDKDGDLDVLVSGTDGSNNQLRVYRSNGDGTFDLTPVEVSGADSGLKEGDVAWGDFDNDNDLDVLASGTDGTNNQLRVYKNNGNGALDSTPIEVAGLNGGLKQGGVAWGDFDNDGDLDIVVSGTDGANNQLRVYKNNGDGTFNGSAIDVAGVNGGLKQGTVAWGDFDSDGDLDILVSGTDGANRQLSLYSNNGNGSFNATAIQVGGVNNGLSEGRATWGDFNKDGHLDALVSGTDGANGRLRVYLNEANGAFNSTPVDVAVGVAGSTFTALPVGDYNVDGNPDIAAFTGALRIYLGQGNGAFNSTAVEVGGSLISGALAGGDAEGDGDLDLLACGSDGVVSHLAIYLSTQSSTATNAFPTAPVALTGAFMFNSTGISVASFPWTSGSDTGAGATTGDALNFDIRISTEPTFASLVVPGQQGAGDRMGPYLRPPQIFNGNTAYGVMLKSTDPWNTQTTAVHGLRTDMTYYFQVKTLDQGLAESGWSNTGTVYTGASPSTSTLTAGAWNATGSILLSWSSAGDDGMKGNLTGHYRIQYATSASIAWSTSSTPIGAYTMTLDGTNVVPGSPQSTTISVDPTRPWYFVIWTQDDVGEWSAVSGAATVTPPAVPAFGYGPFDVAGAGSGLSQGGMAWGDFDKDGDMDVLISGTDGTNNQLRVYQHNGNGTFNATPINVAGVNGGLKDGGAAWGDFDNDADLDILVSGTDGTNNQLRVYKNNGDGTFDSTPVNVAGVNSGLKQGGVAWGDFDNDGDVDVLANGTDGANNQLRVFKNNGNGTFDSSPTNVAGVNGGLRQGVVAWGDFDTDGDLDVLVNGTDGVNRQLRVYQNNGNGTFNGTAIEVAGANNGLADGQVAWGDFNKDGALDVLVSGSDGTNYQLRRHLNNGDGTFNATPVDVAGVNGGATNSSMAVGDYNVDGNIDVAVAGRPNGLVGYWKLDENAGIAVTDLSGQGNNGTLTNGPTWTTGKYGKAVSFDGINDFVTMGDPANGALDLGTGDFSISFWAQVTDPNSNFKMFLVKNTVPGSPSVVPAVGYEIASHSTATGRIRTYLADGSHFALVDGPTGYDVRDGAWHHVVVVAQRAGNARLYLDNVSGTPVSIVAVGNMNTGTNFSLGSAAGSLPLPAKMDDVRIYKRALSAGEVAALYQATKGSLGTLRILKGMGDGSFDATPVEVDEGFENGAAAWGDADGDGDVDLLTAGTDGVSPQLQIYLSTKTLTVSNASPSAPPSLTGTFAFDPSGTSVASFTWTAGSDSGTGATAENALHYDVRISTRSDFVPLVAPGQQGASDRRGLYLNPPKIFNGSTAYGVILKSTDPWTTQNGASYGLRTDTTYYYQIKTLDAGLAESPWSNVGALWAAAPPSTSTLVAVAVGVETGQIDLSWASAGDDGMIGDLNGKYRIQYATTASTAWNPGTTPAGAYTLSIDTTSVTPGAVQSTGVVVNLGIPWYFVIWTQDDAANWSVVSATVSATPPLRPPAPSPVSFTDRTADTLTAQWAWAAAASTYTYVISTAADNPPTLVIGSSDTVALGASIGSLVPNTTYFGFARACNDLGCSTYAAMGATVTVANAPVSLSTSALTSISVHLAWDSNGNSNGTLFDIEHATEPGGPYAIVLSTPGLSGDVLSLVPGGTACVRVVAHSWDGVASPSEELCLIPPFTVPSPGTLAVVGTDSLIGSWGAAPGVTSYTFRVSTAADNPPVLVAQSSVTVALSGTVVSLTPNTTYFGFVTGCNGFDCSDHAALGSAVTDAAPPVSLSSTAVSALAIGLAFNVNGNPTGTLFETEIATDGVSFASALVSPSSSPSITGLVSDVTYSLRVRAVNHAGVFSSYSNVIAILTTAVGPATPVNLRGVAGHLGITYSWDAVSTDQDGAPFPDGTVVTYEISAADLPAGPFAVIASTLVPQYGPVPSAGTERYYRLNANALDLPSGDSTIIDNVGDGRYVYPADVGVVALAPQGILTGEGSPRQVVSLSPLSATDGVLLAFDLTVNDADTHASAGSVTFSPVGQMTVTLPDVASGERPVEYRSGSLWLLVGSAHVGPPHTAQFTIARTGSFRIKNSSGGGVVEAVVPKVFTPNGDGRNDATVIRLDNPDNLTVGGEIYDMDGVQIATLSPGPVPGLSLSWDGRDSHGAWALGGIYVYQVTVGTRRATGTVVLVK